MSVIYGRWGGEETKHKIVYFRMDGKLHLIIIFFFKIYEMFTHHFWHFVELLVNKTFIRRPLIFFIHWLLSSKKKKKKTNIFHILFFIDRMKDFSQLYINIQMLNGVIIITLGFRFFFVFFVVGNNASGNEGFLCVEQVTHATSEYNNHLSCASDIWVFIRMRVLCWLCRMRC